MAMVVDLHSSSGMDSLLTGQKAYFASGITKPLSFRVEQLKKLHAIIKKYEKKLNDACYEDLHKSEKDTYMTEIGICYMEISFTLKRLGKWMKPRKAKTPMTHFGSKSYIYPEPYGSALIIAPWNYPINLAIAPLIGAIAAGNCAVVKPSELTPTVSAVLRDMLGEAFAPEYIAVVEGGAEESKELLKLPFDYIFFTGSVQVGKQVMESASRYLTPVTLELGGKSPVIVHKDANLRLAAKRIAWAKTLNAGQTCVAPDYLLVHEDVKDQLLEEMKKVGKAFYGEDPVGDEDYTRIVNERHFDRLVSYLKDGRILFGGSSDRETRAIEFTVMDNVEPDAPVMQDEIFGPILPVLTYKDFAETIAFVNARPKPLSFYLFTGSKELEARALASVSFGGGCVNDAIFHLATPYLPFGGVGNSGMGAYHGKASFDTFTHSKSVMHQTTRFDLKVRYPHGKRGLRLLKKLMK
ncbi:aldehyde dehydrogenase [Gorillibacterium massiliense]|uniref:aldehyde dehydrogenase n=1 Tax=Gorillibacterium massiliense TaxID=1280390 RepID=UPI001EE2A46B|nr:aldehyde dehydrogenase [Gorillibacterium massiliense]